MACLSQMEEELDALRQQVAEQQDAVEKNRTLQEENKRLYNQVQVRNYHALYLCCACMNTLEFGKCLDGAAV